MNFDEGFYLFGGMNDKGELKNDLWLIEPYISENEKMLSSTTCDYVVNPPCISLSISRVVGFKGRPPAPRIQHSAHLFKNWDHHFFIVIYGGRNDSIYQRT
jgi:hypothetical protein